VLSSCCRTGKTRIAQFTLPAISTILTSEQIRRASPRYLSSQSTVASIEQVTCYNCIRLIHHHFRLPERLPLCRDYYVAAFFFTAGITWSLPSHATSVRQPRRCFLPVRAFSPWTSLLGYLGLVFSWSSALHGIEPTTGCESRHSQRHLLSQIWQLRKMPLPPVTGYRASEDVQYLEWQLTSPFPAVPVPEARSVSHHPFFLLWRIER
jgi:hypothetical protein